jgi:hypothetical protein
MGGAGKYAACALAANGQLAYLVGFVPATMGGIIFPSTHNGETMKA